MLKFKVDENLPTAAVKVFAEAGHDALSVLDEQMGGEADATIAAVCRTEGRAIVTLDLDFADIRNYPRPIIRASLFCGSHDWTGNTFSMCFAECSPRWNSKH